MSAQPLVPSSGKSIQFEDLPSEIKDYIWTFALPDPRIIRLDIIHAYGRPTEVDMSQTADPAVTTTVWTVETPVPPPAHLSLCLGARIAALRHYERSSAIFHISEKGKQAIWISYERDTLFSSVLVSTFLKAIWLISEKLPDPVYPEPFDPLRVKFVAFAISKTLSTGPINLIINAVMRDSQFLKWVFAIFTNAKECSLVIDEFAMGARNPSVLVHAKDGPEDSFSINGKNEYERRLNQAIKRAKRGAPSDMVVKLMYSKPVDSNLQPRIDYFRALNVTFDVSKNSLVDGASYERYGASLLVPSENPIVDDN